MDDDKLLLADAFVAHLDDAVRDSIGDLDTISEQLDALVATATAAWPDVALTPMQFVARVAERLPAGEVSAQLDQLRPADLFLACGCALGDTTALATFEREFLPVVDGALAKMRATHETMDEVRQMLREKLLVAAPPAEPRIADYAGRGSLRNWLRATAVRTYLNLLRKHKKEIAPDDERMLSALPASGDDPELAHLKSTYRDEFKAAFLEALTELADRELNVLRHYYVDDLTIDQLGAMYRVHRVTAFRWVDKARDKLATRTRKRLQTRLKISKTELESIMRLIQSQLDISIATYLGKRRPPADGDD